MGLINWLASKFNRPVEKATSNDTPNAPTSIRGKDPRPFLAGSAPGLWSSNHLDESKNVTSFQFVAIRQKATMCSNAELKVHRVEDKADLSARLAKVERSIRKCRTIADAVERTYKTERLEQKRQALSDRLHKMSTGTGPESVKGDRTPVDSSHPLYRLLSRPNPEWSGSTFIYALAQQISSTGVGLVWAIRNGAGIPVELYVIPTGLAIPRLPTPAYPNGSYYITPISTWGVAPNDVWSDGVIGQAMLTGAEVDKRDVKKICWPHPFFLTDGLSPMSAGSLWVDLGNEMDRASWYRFQNAERPGMIFKRDKDIDPDPADVAQFREDLKADAAGTPNTGKHLILPPGIEPVNWNNTERELEFVDSRPQIRDMNLALHGLTPISFGFAEAQAYAAYWAAIKQTTELSVQPLLGLIGGELTELLGTAFQDGRYEITYNAPAIDDPQLLENRLQTDIDAGNVLLVKEYRAMRGLPLLGDERDDQFVGEVTNVRVQAQDADPTTPGIQVEDKGETGGGGGKDEGKGTGNDKKGEDKGPGVESPFKAAPGRSTKSRRRLTMIRKGVFREEDHPRASDGRFGEKPGDSSGSDDNKKRPPKQSPGNTFQDSAKSAHEAFSSGQIDADEFRSRVESMVEEYDASLSDAFDTYHSKEVSATQHRVGEQIVDHPDAANAFKEYTNELESIRSDLSNAADAIIDSADDEDAFASSFDAWQEERQRASKRLAQATMEYNNAVDAVNYELYQDAESRTADLNSDMYEGDPEGAEGDAKLINSELEAEGNPYRVVYAEGDDDMEGEWVAELPKSSDNITKTINAMRRKYTKTVNRLKRQGKLDKTLADLPSKIGEQLAKVMEVKTSAPRKRHVALVVDPETERVKGMDITEE